MDLMQQFRLSELKEVMMAIKSMFFNAVFDGTDYDREYNADDFSAYLNKIISNGVFPNPSTNLQVRASSGMNIVIGAGDGWIDGHKIIVNADEIMTLDAADTLLGRIDRVVFYCDYTTREMGIAILKGDVSATPVAPDLTRNNDRYEMSLATISVPKQVTTITNAMITDTRADNEVCGWTAVLIDQIDTSTLFLQWQTAYADYYADIKAQLDAFIETLTQDLAVNTFLVSYEKTQSYSGSTTSIAMALDMTGYTWESTDVIQVYINGLLGVAGTDYTLTGSTTKTVNITFAAAGTLANDIQVKVLKTRMAINHT